MNDDGLKTEVEIDLDSQNPREVHVIIKSQFKDMATIDLYDALHILVHDILEPELKGKINPTGH